jgi:hypothetical protein
MPAADECCGEGCRDCVFNDYMDALAAWEAAEAARRGLPQ